jgi:hypothetical protein
MDLAQFAVVIAIGGGYACWYAIHIWNRGGRPW